MEFTTRSTPAALPVRRSSSNHPKSGRPRNSSHTPARHHSRGNEERCIRISNLHRKTVAPTIFDVFAKFGTVEKVEINMDDNDQPDGTAFVLFAKAILNPSLVPSQLSIDGRPVKLEFVSEKALQNITWRNTPPGKRSQILVRQFSMGSLLEPKIFIEEWSATDDAAIVINYDMRQIQIFFNHLDTRYRLEFKFKDLLGDPKLERDDGATYFTVCLRNASRAWRQKKSLTVSKYSVSNNSQWERVIDIPLKAKEGGATSQSPDPASKRKPIMPIAREDTVNLGSWLVYRILFSTSPRYQDTLERLLDEAAEYNLVPRDARLQQKTFKVILASSLPRPKTHIERAKLLPFEVLWNLESLILANYFNEYNLDDDFYDMIVKLDPAVSCGILDLIATQKKRVWHPTLAFHEIWEKMGMKVLHQKRIPGYCAMMRKFVVTPSSIQILPPTLETTNRVIRHFRDHSERFARVQFVDEGGSRVSASHGGLNNEVIYNRIYKVLQNGIQIGSRRYDFLAMSSSQLREHGCWFFAPSRDLTPPMIRQWMGVFSHVKIVAKHAVRMGQVIF
ncbi:RNA dependent RNA polymerase-domain-containing protein [Radiomyces spectabilis]|uniref:RNA dependent RNA polymerase-domain-containing protein n=1 Tax=Radiomyces spectabilis TaxID=64574 RepID=UPI002220A624|nr:RNA dependent RNA polymerase-domain-containing protein [Radiomyces spectabilis]KAI8388532.1 RNA dependent RNA polymerase-domain-containing protein [Radiomyces spectabilis]